MYERMRAYLHAYFHAYMHVCMYICLYVYVCKMLGHISLASFFLNNYQWYKDILKKPSPSEYEHLFDSFTVFDQHIFEMFYV